MRVNVVQRKDTGQFRVKMRAKDEAGTWVTKWVKGAFLSRQEAEACKAQLEASAARGNVTTLDRSSVAGYVEEWLGTRQAMGQIEASSAYSYRTMLKRVLDHLGDLPLATLTGRDIQAAYTKMMVAVSPQSASLAHRIFQCAIRDAVKTGRLLADPFLRVEPPRAKKVRKKTTLTAEQVAAFVEAHRGTQLGLLIELLAVSGMRVGEACALQWQDFDWAKQRVSIERNLALLPNNGSYVKAPKTEAGMRVVALPPDTVARLREVEGKATDTVFPSPYPRFWTRTITRALAAAGMGQFSTHDLRHAHATFLLRHANPKAVSKRLGHSDVKITLNTYAHVFEEDDDALGGLAGGLVGQKGEAT
jgi:integrase